jgi:hypothetical protein
MVPITISITSQYAVILSVIPFQLTETGVVNNKQTGIQMKPCSPACLRRTQNVQLG